MTRMATLLIALALGATACGGGTGAPETSPSDSAGEASGELVVASLGGSYQEAQSEAFMQPFAEETGVEVTETAAEGVARLQAMVETGNVEWDVVDLGPQELQLATELDLLEPIDYSVVDRSVFYEGAATTDYGVGTIYSTGVLAWNTDEIQGDPPQDFADFWDLEKYPGKRALAAYGPDFNLEYALLADGVPMDELYPLDVDRAFEKLDEIKDETIFYDTNEQAMQLITSGEAVMGTAPNGRVFNAINDGQPIDYTWNQGGLFIDYWAVPKGAPNAANAMRFIEFASQAERQAEMAQLIPYGGTNESAVDLLDEEVLDNLPTAPDNFELQYVPDAEWWAENIEEVTERWQAWLLE
jgi:putative spermidine/putrescine transport system substrate-binding protein